MLEMAKETFRFYKHKTTKIDNQQQKQTTKSRDCIIRSGQYPSAIHVLDKRVL